MPPKITELAARLLTDPIHVNVTPKTSSVKRIDQSVHFVERHNKQTLLKTMVTADGVERVIVFTKTKRGANVVAEKLHRSGISSAAIHGNKSQNARQKALESFRNNEIQVLVATDVAARGIDIDGVTHVINYDLPIEPEAYVHRIGRTGRAGAEGIAVSFCSSEEIGDLRAIEKLIGQKVPVSGGTEPAPSASVRPSGQSRGRRPSGQQGGRSSGHGRSPSSTPGSRHAASRRASEATGSGDSPKPRRRRRRPSQVS